MDSGPATPISRDTTETTNWEPIRGEEPGDTAREQNTGEESPSRHRAIATDRPTTTEIALRREPSLHRNPTRRTKQKCHFGPNKAHKSRHPTQLEQQTVESSVEEMDVLLREIDTARRQDLQPRPVLLNPSNTRPRSRSKRKCEFGPSKQKDKTPRSTDADTNQGDIPTRAPANNTQEGYPEPYQRTHIPADRVTLMPPGPPGASSSRTPFDYYKATAAEAPRPNPYRFVLQRLGITEQRFDEELTREINERVSEARAECRLEQRFVPNPNNEERVPRILTKEDCLCLFAATGVPTSGPLEGVYRWAADLGRAQFECVAELEDHELHYLDAYL